MTSILEMWKSNSTVLAERSVQQVLGFCGDGKLKDGNSTAAEFRELLANIPSVMLARFARECLDNAFSESGLALQDIMNHIGVRLGFTVQQGRYRGVKNEIGFDGIWTSKDGYRLVLEVKTTDAYRINLDTIAAYRDKLINDEKLKETESAILIVVGRQDTGDLEAQIRGSRHAWDVRLISTEALLRLMALKENLSDWATSLKINEILRPMEYTRVDPIIDLVFRTSQDLTDEGDGEPATDKAVTQPKQKDPTKAVDIKSIRAEAIPIVSAYVKTDFIKKGQALFSSVDGATNLICLASQEYQVGQYENYWYGISPSQTEFLQDAESAFVALACGSPQRIVLFPFEDFEPLIEHMHETPGKHKHIQLYWKNGIVLMDQPRTGPKLDVTKYVIPMKQ